MVLALVLIAWGAAVCVHRAMRGGLRALDVPQLLRATWQQDPARKARAEARHLEFWRVAFKVLVFITLALLSFQVARLQGNGQGLEQLVSGRAE